MRGVNVAITAAYRRPAEDYEEGPARREVGAGAVPRPRPRPLGSIASALAARTAVSDSRVPELTFAGHR